MTPLKGPEWAQRFAALLLVVVGIPGVLTAAALRSEAPIREGEPSPRTVVAPDLIRVVDQEATERARRDAAESVTPEAIEDNEARAAIVQDVRDAFAAAQAVRIPGDEERVPAAREQIEALRDRLPMLDDAALRLLVGLPDDDLEEVADEAEQIARQIALQPISEDQVEAVTEEELRNELVVRSFPEGVGSQIVDPIIRSAVRPTVREDEDVSQAARETAADEVAEVVQSYPGGSVIVSAGEVVSPVQMAALQARGLGGADPLRSALQTLGLTLVVGFALAFYLRTYRQPVWESARRLVLLSCLFLLFTITLQAVVLVAPGSSSGWLFLVPAGAVAMLATILFDPPVGVLSTVPVTALVAYTVPGKPGVAAFAAVAALVSVPLVSRLSARGDLRRAAWQSTLGYGLLAPTFAAVFGDAEAVPVALSAGLLNGVITAVVVNGSLPFLESLFGVVTATSLLDLADRNHPLLRALEQKALGSYNHSIMVSTMVERASRAIGADGLLGSVAALYHDIGKVQRPYFFVENQFGIANPHDELAPEVSAEIIQRHVTDGVEMARSSRLPAEVVEGIATHHGTTLVSYFYMQALNRTEAGEVDEEVYRYKGRKPASKEMAILMLADCCEGASRAAALHDRNLTRDALERIVHQLVADRVDDGQLDEANLTFRELTTVQDSFIEALVGVYHPRITYPQRARPAPVSAAGQRTRPEVDATAASPNGEMGVQPDGPRVEADRDDPARTRH